MIKKYYILQIQNLILYKLFSSPIHVTPYFWTTAEAYVTAKRWRDNGTNSLQNMSFPHSPALEVNIVRQIHKLAGSRLGLLSCFPTLVKRISRRVVET